MMARVVVVSVLGWFSVFGNAEVSLLLPPPVLVSPLHSPVSQPTYMSRAFSGNWRNHPSPGFLGWHHEKTVGAGVYVQKSQSSHMLAVGPRSRRYFINPSLWDHSSLLALKMVSTSVGRHGTDCCRLPQSGDCICLLPSNLVCWFNYKGLGKTRSIWFSNPRCDHPKEWSNSSVFRLENFSPVGGAGNQIRVLRSNKLHMLA